MYNTTNLTTIGRAIVVVPHNRWGSTPTPADSILRWLSSTLEAVPEADRGKVSLLIENHGKEPSLSLVRELSKDEQEAAMIRDSLSFLQSFGITADAIRQQLESPTPAEP